MGKIDMLAELYETVKKTNNSVLVIREDIQDQKMRLSKLEEELAKREQAHEKAWEEYLNYGKGGSK